MCRRPLLPVLVLLVLSGGCNLILPLEGGAPGQDAAPDGRIDGTAVDLSDAARADRGVDARTSDLPAPDLPPLPATVSTVAGTGQTGSDDGPVNGATFFQPHSVAVDSQGQIYVADYNNHCIRRIENGTVSTVAGTCGSPGDTDGTAGQFRYPCNATLDDSETTLYVAEFEGHRIRTVDTATGKVATLTGTGSAGYQDGTLNEALFTKPCDVAVVQQGAGTMLYVAEFGGNRIRAIDPAQGQVSTLTGSSGGHLDGPFATALFSQPHTLLHDGGSAVYVSDFGSDCVRKLDLAQQTVSTVATCDFDQPSGLALDAARGLLYVSEFGGHKIKGVTLATGAIADVAGTGVSGFQDGPVAAAQFNAPEGLFLDHGKLYIAEFYGNRIRVLE